jgi:DegV family protein with EDD domain
MAQNKEPVSTAAPAPHLYQRAIESIKSDFLITVSSKLSSSYSHAMAAGEQLLRDIGHAVHIFDSKTASAGQTLVAIKLHELLAKGLPKEQVIADVQNFINSIRTYLVLENYENLQKNGRLGRVAGSLIKVLNITLIMGDDRDGSIVLHGKARGETRMIDQLLSFIDKSGRNTKGENLVLSHVNNFSLAERLAALITDRFDFKRIFIVPTSGICTLYGDDKGIIIAF